MAALGLLQLGAGCGMLGGERYSAVEVGGLPSAAASLGADYRL